MSIRYYLLLFVGVVSSLLFIGSFLVEGLLLRTRTQAVREETMTYVSDLFANRQKQFQEFVERGLAEKSAKLQVLLDAIVSFAPLRQWFCLSPEDTKQGSWQEAATLLEQNEWVRFLQNTQGGKTLSLLMPEAGPLPAADIIPITDGVAWVYVLAEPWIGVEIPLKQEGDLRIEGKRSYLLYSLPTLEKGGMLPSVEEDLSICPTLDVEEQLFLLHLTRAIAFAQSKPIVPPCKQEIPAATTRCMDFFSCEESALVNQAKSYASELFSLWQVCVLKQKGALEGLLPEAVVTEKQEVVVLEHVLRGPSPLFDEAAFLQAHPPLGGVSSGLGLLASSKDNTVYLLSVATLPEGSALTLGIDIGSFLEEISQVFGQYSFLVQSGKVVAGSQPSKSMILPQEEIVRAATQKESKASGTFSIANKQYHFFSLKPSTDADFTFVFIHMPEDDFSYFLSFQEKLTKAVRSIATERNFLLLGFFVLLWLCLVQVSKKLTRPILSLADSLQMVKEAKWDKIPTPSVHFGKNNEIQMLYDAFYAMVQGMKDKEKVMAILNKVVSEEIAAEILKGGVQLGGEERVVTMLFADIRDFTFLTQDMPPQDIIALLNKCMTKLSLVVEKHHGVIDKYMGDGLMALYGAPLELDRSALYAIASGLAMVHAVHEWSLERLAQGRSAIEVGVGIHRGPVCAGNMGAQHRLNYTVIGSSVNLAARICASALSGEVLITASTYEQEQVKKWVRVEDRGMRELKGFDELVHVYHVVAMEDGWRG